jgi:prepilin-type N-terminal cleavage/methylation domain-containing protein
MDIKPPTRRNGFTLIEIMIALLVITVGIVAMTGLLGTSLDTSAKSHDDLHAVSFADMVFNYCHSVTNWDAIPTRGSLDLPDYDGGTTELQLDSLAQFTCSIPPQEVYTVSYLLGIQQPTGSIKELTLQVWPGHGTNGTARTFYTEIYNWVKNQ